MTTPEKISSTTVLELLAHIQPPPLQPLPPHLLSTALLQRHRFLDLHPAIDPIQYLSWPDPHQQSAFDLLGHIPDSLPLSSEFVTRYTSDPESTYAHVRITPDASPGLRLIFHWEPPDGWKYHNLALMPFPPNSFTSPLHSPKLVSSMDETNEDSYWSAYGQDDPDLNPAYDHIKGHVQQHSEDDYWARYSSVQGSGDSTLPSPHPNKRKLVQPYPIHPDTVYNPLEPPSPSSLSRRLETLSPRRDSPSLVGDSSTDSITSSSPVPPPDIPGITHEFVLLDDNHHPAGSPTDEILKQSIQATYRLWNAASSPSNRRNHDQFLRIVREAIAEL